MDLEALLRIAGAGVGNFLLLVALAAFFKGKAFPEWYVLELRTRLEKAENEREEAIAHAERLVESSLRIAGVTERVVKERQSNEAQELTQEQREFLEWRRHRGLAGSGE